MLRALNAQFGIPGSVDFFRQADEGPIMLSVENRRASAEICLQGGHCTAWAPRGVRDVLWMSPLARFEHRRAIRGGIPVLWPWFGDHPNDAQQPAHGFVRTLDWEVVDVGRTADGGTRIRLGLSDSVVTRQHWPHAFDLNLTIRVGTVLELCLTAWNTGNTPVRCGGGFHPYFAVGDVRRTVVSGLDGREYLDKVKGMRRYPQDGDLRFRKEVDRVFLQTEGDVLIRDPQMRRHIRVSGEGSSTRVVWNPWVDKAASLSDFPDDGWRDMLCVEVVNARDDTRLINPGQSHTICQRIHLESS